MGKFQFVSFLREKDLNVTLKIIPKKKKNTYWSRSVFSIECSAIYTRVFVRNQKNGNGRKNFNNKHLY